MSVRPPLLFCLLLVAALCSAQAPTQLTQYSASPFDNRFGLQTSVTGSVKDISGHPVSGVRVELHNMANGQVVASSYTNEVGGFQIPPVPIGQYEVVATSGLSETRVQTLLVGEPELNLRINSNLDNTGAAVAGNSTVSLSQMQVPGKARRLMQKAEEAFNKSHFQDAFDFVQKALVAFPNYAQALTLRGVLNLQKGDTKSAKPDLEKAVELDGGDSMGFIALASLYNTEGDYDHALKVIQRGISLSPRAWPGYFEQAKAEIGKRQYHKSLSSLQRAAEFAPPQVAPIHLWRAKALIGLGSLQEAITELNAYLERNPQAPDADRIRDTISKLQGAVLAAKK